MSYNLRGHKESVATEGQTLSLSHMWLKTTIYYYFHGSMGCFSSAMHLLLGLSQAAAVR